MVRVCNEGFPLLGRASGCHGRQLSNCLDLRVWRCPPPPPSHVSGNSWFFGAVSKGHVWREPWWLRGGLQGRSPFPRRRRCGQGLRGAHASVFGGGGGGSLCPMPRPFEFGSRAGVVRRTTLTSPIRPWQLLTQVFTGLEHAGAPAAPAGRAVSAMYAATAVGACSRPLYAGGLTQPMGIVLALSERRRTLGWRSGCPCGARCGPLSLSC